MVWPKGLGWAGPRAWAGLGQGNPTLLSAQMPLRHPVPQTPGQRACPPLGERLGWHASAAGGGSDGTLSNARERLTLIHGLAPSLQHLIRIAKLLKSRCAGDLRRLLALLLLNTVCRWLLAAAAAVAATRRLRCKLPRAQLCRCCQV